MTDSELIQLIEQSSPGELTPEDVGLLRERAAVSDQVRSAVADRIRMEQVLTQTLGRPPFSVPQLVAAAVAGSAATNGAAVGELFASSGGQPSTAASDGAVSGGPVSGAAVSGGVLSGAGTVLLHAMLTLAALVLPLALVIAFTPPPARPVMPSLEKAAERAGLPPFGPPKKPEVDSPSDKLPPGFKVPAVKEPAAKEPAAKEPAAKEPAAKERPTEIKEQPGSGN